MQGTEETLMNFQLLAAVLHLVEVSAHVVGVSVSVYLQRA
jgi:hypothetical protein